jgi:hypothetical protein
MDIGEMQRKLAVNRGSYAETATITGTRMESRMR